ncbi:MAG: hypothetical protein Q9P01_16710 [Anaerolineae bacterium]|nr:hypothetical protein [Anaerolineae bacterium]
MAGQETVLRGMGHGNKQNILMVADGGYDNDQSVSHTCLMGSSSWLVALKNRVLHYLPPEDAHANRKNSGDQCSGALAKIFGKNRKTKWRKLKLDVRAQNTAFAMATSWGPVLSQEASERPLLL